MRFEDEQMILVASEIAVAEAPGAAVRHFPVTFDTSDTPFEDHVSGKTTGSRVRRVLVLEKSN